WNDFLWPLITIYSPNNMTLQLGLTTFSGAHQTATNLLMAANVMSVLPVLLLFFLAQRWFIRGIADTGLKGEAPSQGTGLAGGDHQGIPGRGPGGRRRVAGGARWRVPRPGGALGLRQDDRAAPDRRAGEGHLRHGHHRQPGGERHLAARPGHRDGLPELRAVPAHD